jgi:hypothetical protein
MPRNPLVKLAGIALLLFSSGLAGCASVSVGPSFTANAPDLAPATTHATSAPATPGDTRPLLAITEPRSDAIELVNLDSRLRQILTTTGYRIILPPDHVPPGLEIYFISPEITDFEISWIVADADGDPLGKIAQRRITSAPNDNNENMILLGAAAAADGIHQIIRKQS